MSAGKLVDRLEMPLGWIDVPDGNVTLRSKCSFLSINSSTLNNLLVGKIWLSARAPHSPVSFRPVNGFAELTTIYIGFDDEQIHIFVNQPTACGF